MNNKHHIIYICFISILLISFPLYESFRKFTLEEDRFHYAMLIRIENRTNEDLIAVGFPIPISRQENGIYIDKTKIEKGEISRILCYAGKDKNVPQENVLGVAVWKTFDEKDLQIFQRKPYAVRTFYNPEYEIGPEKYEDLAKWIVE